MPPPAEPLLTPSLCLYAATSHISAVAPYAIHITDVNNAQLLRYVDTLRYAATLICFCHYFYTPYYMRFSLLDMRLRYDTRLRQLPLLLRLLIFYVLHTL